MAGIREFVHMLKDVNFLTTRQATSRAIAESGRAATVSSVQGEFVRKSHRVAHVWNMNMKVGAYLSVKILLGAVGIATAVMLTSTTVSYADPAHIDGKAPNVASGVGTLLSPKAIDTCTGSASFEGQGSNSLENGTLTAGFCRYTAGGVGTVNIQYQKDAGSPVTVDFAWEFVDSSGSNTSTRYYDNGSFTISAGQTRTFQWSYPSPGKYPTSGNTGCYRGVMIVGVDDYSTRVVC